jgi:ribonuclease P protein component
MLRILGDQKSTKISAVSPKKILNTAVVRNKARRRIYDVVRTFLPNVKSGSWVLIFIKATAVPTLNIGPKGSGADHTNNTLQIELEAVFKKASILR